MIHVLLYSPCFSKADSRAVQRKKMKGEVRCQLTKAEVHIHVAVTIVAKVQWFEWAYLLFSNQSLLVFFQEVIFD